MFARLGAEVLNRAILTVAGVALIFWFGHVAIFFGQLWVSLFHQAAAWIAR